MIKLQNPLGSIEISEEYIEKLICNTAASCYGVLEIPNNKSSQELKCDIFKDSYKGKCVKLTSNDDKLIIDLDVYKRQISALFQAIWYVMAVNKKDIFHNGIFRVMIFRLYILKELKILINMDMVFLLNIIYLLLITVILSQ